MTTRDIQAQLQELYGVEVSPTFISNVTEEVMEEVRQWQNRPLEALYPILYVDCLVVKQGLTPRLLVAHLDQELCPVPAVFPSEVLERSWRTVRILLRPR